MKNLMPSILGLLLTVLMIACGKEELPIAKMEQEVVATTETERPTGEVAGQRTNDASSSNWILCSGGSSCEITCAPGTGGATAICHNGIALCGCGTVGLPIGSLPIFDPSLVGVFIGNLSNYLETNGFEDPYKVTDIYLKVFEAIANEDNEAFALHVAQLDEEIDSRNNYEQLLIEEYFSE